MSTIVTRAGKGSPLTHNEVDANFNNLNNDKYQSGDSPSFAGTTLSSGNLTFSSTAQRITGDMSTATFSNRLAFQTSTANSATSISSLPNGTGTASNINCYNNSDPTNSSLLLAGTNATEALIQSAIRGTGTYLPMTFYTGGSERMRLDTSGNLGLGATPSGSYKFEITGGTNQLKLEGAAQAAITLKKTGVNGTTLYTDAANNLVVYRDGVGATATFDASGNVGIGTNTSNQKATIWTGGTLPSTIANCQLLVGDTTGFANAGLALTTAAGNGSAIFFGSTATPTLGRITYDNTNNYMELFTNSSARMRIDSSGNVGIGTASPESGFKLHVLGDTFVQNASGSNIGKIVKL